MGSDWISRRLEISDFDQIFLKILLSERYRSSKKHRVSMFWVFKTLSRLRAIHWSNNRDHTTRRSENIEGKVKTPLKTPLKKKVPCIGL